jgi:protein-ribulosamine 3-kinase
MTTEGRSKSFFLKECRDTNVEDMVQAEYDPTAALYAVALNNVPKPLAYGSFATDPARLFYVQFFCNMQNAPSHVETFIDKLVALLAKIHLKESPTGKFGFHITSTHPSS